MQRKYLFLLTLLLHSHLAVRAEALEPEKRQNGDQVVLSLSQIVSQFLPASNLPEVIAAVESAASSASQTNMTQVWENVVMGPTPPAYLTHLPTQYQTQLVGLESAMVALRDSIVSSAAAAVSISTAGSANTKSANTPVSSMNSTKAVVSSTVGATTAAQSSHAISSTTGAIIAVQSSSAPTKSASTVSPVSTPLFTGYAARLIPGAVSILALLGLVVVL